MDIDETGHILANLYGTCDRCSELTNNLWLADDGNRAVCATCHEALGGDLDAK